MKIRFSVDRVDENSHFVICFDENQKKYIFPFELIGLGAGELFDAELDVNGLPHGVQPLPEETAKRRQELHSRTSALFRRNKK